MRYSSNVHGQLIYEEYFDGFDEKWGTSLGKISMTVETKHDLRSVTKSVVSALVGIAHGEGAIKSLDEPLIKWFPSTRSWIHRTADV